MQASHGVNKVRKFVHKIKKKIVFPMCLSNLLVVRKNLISLNSFKKISQVAVLFRVKLKWWIVCAGEINLFVRTSWSTFSLIEF